MWVKMSQPVLFWEGGEGWVSGEVGQQGSIIELCPIFWLTVINYVQFCLNSWRSFHGNSCNLLYTTLSFQTSYCHILSMNWKDAAIQGCTRAVEEIHAHCVSIHTLCFISIRTWRTSVWDGHLKADMITCNIEVFISVTAQLQMCNTTLNVNT